MFVMLCGVTLLDIVAELAERSPIIIQNSSNPSSRKNLDVRPYDCATVQGATFNMRGQRAKERKLS